MAYRVDYRESDQLGIIELWDDLDADGIAAAMLACYNQPAWRFGSNTLWDGRRIKSLSIDVTDLPRIRTAMARATELAGPGKSAIVVTRDIDFVVAKLLSAMRSSRERDVKPFYAIEDAAAWLEIAVESIEST